MNSSLPHPRLTASTKCDAQWSSMIARDPEADGNFSHSVKTTDLYCQPSVLVWCDPTELPRAIVGELIASERC